MNLNSHGNIIDNKITCDGISRSCTVKAMPIAPMLLVVFLFSMWDIYLPQLGLRILDFIGVGLLLFWISFKLYVNIQGISIRPKNLQSLGMLIAWCLIFSIVGLIGSIENLKPISGILMGVAVFSFFYTIILDDRSVAKALSIIIVIHAFYLIFQYLFYQTFGVVVNLSEFLGGEEPRALSSIFRPTGLFLEPAAYALSMLMLLSLRVLIVKSFDAITLLALGTIFLTLSLWGLIVNIIFLLIFSEKNTKFFVVITIAILVVIVGLSFIGADWLDANDSPLVRLNSITDDSSANVRFGGLIDNGTYTIATIELWLGKGISNDYHEFGSSGLAFILSAGGLFGAGVLFLLIINLIPRNRKFISLIFILLFLTAAPIFTTMYWWFWLALITRKYEHENNL